MVSNRFFMDGMPYFFISYSHADKEIVHRIHDALAELGYNLWIDEKCMGVSRDRRAWNDIADQALVSKDCLGILFMRSGNSVGSPQTFRELIVVDEWNNVNEEMRKDIITVNLDKHFRLSNYEEHLDRLKTRSFTLSRSEDSFLQNVVYQEIRNYLTQPDSIVNQARRELYDYLQSRKNSFRYVNRLKELPLETLQEKDVRSLFECLTKELQAEYKNVKDHHQLINDDVIAILYEPGFFEETIRELADELDKSLAERGMPSPRAGREEVAATSLAEEAVQDEDGVNSSQEVSDGEVPDGKRKTAAELFRSIVELLVNRHPEKLDDLMDGTVILADHDNGKKALHKHRCEANGRIYYISTHSSTKDKGRTLRNKILQVFGITVPTQLMPLDKEEKLEALLTYLLENGGGSEPAAGDGGRRKGRKRSENSDKAIYLDILTRVLEDELDDAQVNEVLGDRSLQLFRNQEEADAHMKAHLARDTITVRGRDVIVGVNINTGGKVSRVEKLLRRFGLEQRIDLNYPEGLTDREKLLFVQKQLHNNT